MSTLTVSKPVSKTSWIDAETQLVQTEQRIANEVLKSNPIFPLDVTNIITQYAVEIPSCSICLQDIAYPVILECGHLFDLDCISDWARKENTCPIDRTIIDIGRIRYAEGVVKRVSAVFNFRFLSGSQIDPITVNVHSSVQRLKSLMSLGVSINEKNLMVAVFSPHARKIPRDFICLVSRKILYPDTHLSVNGIKPGSVYDMYVRCKLAQYGNPCDRCFHDPEKEQTCNHPDEDDTMTI